jgi:hypothetical protein
MTLQMIKTDWLAVKCHRWRLAIIAVIVALFAVAKMTIVLLPIVTYMAIAFSMNAFAVEEKGKLEHLYLSLPLTRKSIVRGRYAFMLAMIAASILVCGGVMAILKPRLEFGAMAFGGMAFGVGNKVIAVMCLAGFAFGGFINLSMYPVMFRIGYEKGKIFGFYIPIVIIALIFGGMGYLVNAKTELVIGWLTYWFSNPLQVGAIMFAIGAALYYVSYRLSLWLYETRNL